MSKVIPILRVFDYDKAIEFYINWLGFMVDWQHMPENLPAYFQISLRDVVLNLSEHHGDSSPGAHIRITGFEDLKEYHKTLIGKNYKYNRPGLEKPDWNPDGIEMTVHDPFGNRLTFSEEG